VEKDLSERFDLEEKVSRANRRAWSRSLPLLLLPLLFPCAAGIPFNDFLLFIDIFYKSIICRDIHGRAF